MYYLLMNQHLFSLKNSTIIDFIDILTSTVCALQCFQNVESIFVFLGLCIGIENTKFKSKCTHPVSAREIE